MSRDEFDVVVVGAGAAGLGAGRALAASGLSVLILEARARPGGRAWTVKLANGEPADLGCGWLHSADQNPLAPLAEGLPIRYACPVSRIDHSGPLVALTAPQGAVRARAVVVTLPSDVLAAAPDLFFPALPEKTAAAAALPLGLADKLYMALDAPDAVPADSRAFGKLAVATGAYHFRPLGRPLVEGYFGGELAESLERGGRAAAWDFAAAELAALFGADFVKRLTPLAFHGWRSDPYARGGYSYAKPGFAGSRAVLAAPVEDRIFFAGEACSAGSFSTAHGAYETGREAARAAETALAARNPR